MTTPLLHLYRIGAALIGPLAHRRVAAKLRAQDVPIPRLRELTGTATHPRPEGRLIWFHAASVGETLSVLALITRWGEAHPDCTFLITSGTATSAQIVAGRLPPRTLHQFAPLDAPGYVRRFLAHWRPDAALFVESELWPNMLHLAHQARVPLALINARISDRSAKRWGRIRRSAAQLLGLFTHIHCQDQRTEAHFHALGQTQARLGPNLKSLSGPLPFDRAEHQRMARVLQGRPVWLAASTHPGEDEIVLSAHRTLLAAHPGLVLILAPRHPERADAIEVQIAEAGLSGTRRSAGGQIDGSKQVYLADTLGEMGLWYALSPLTCLCGSFTPVGGHNPFEPAHAGSAILHGPHYANFTAPYAALDRLGAATQVTEPQTLAQEAEALLGDAPRLLAMRDAARSFASTQEDALDQITADLSKALSVL